MFTFGVKMSMYHGKLLVLIICVWLGNSLEMYDTFDSNQRVCPQGHYCVNGAKMPCSAGSYNPNVGKSNCIPCPSNARCPIGSINPIVTKKTDKIVDNNENINPTPSKPKERLCDYGYYCPPGEGKAIKCAAGVFGASTNLTTPLCSGICPSGFFCPPGTIKPQPCPSDSRYFCPSGSRSPLLVKEGMYVNENTEMQCDVGYYCDANAIRNACPAGTYGDALRLTNSSCSGLCKAGFYCPAGSTSSTQIKCTNPAQYCPEGSGAPIQVSVGYYSTEACSKQEVCPLGHYCTDGRKFACPPGTYNSGQTGLSNRNQCTPCPRGFVCFKESMEECGVQSTYCPAAEPESPLLAQKGYYTYTDGSLKMIRTAGQCDTQLTNSSCVTERLAPYWPHRTVYGKETMRSKIVACEPGHYCINGERYECPPGTFGDVPMLSNSTCSGNCTAGYYCPAASTSSTQRKCPEFGYYCPAGTGAPIAVDPGDYVADEQAVSNNCEPGFYCTDIGEKYPCPAGTYGSDSSLNDVVCSGRCPPGYYCPTGTSNKFSNPCDSPDQYCPSGSTEPLPVQEGYYSNDDRSWQNICEPGNYCAGGVKKECPGGTFGDVSGLSSSKCAGTCPKGHFCPPGSSDATKYSCTDVLGYVADASTSYANNLQDTSCIVHMLNIYPEQFFEFSLLADRTERDPSQWNLAKDKRGIYEPDLYNTMEWDDTEKGFRSRGQGDQYLQTGWKPPAGEKTMCMWKKLKSTKLSGIDGMQKREGANDYFMIGMYSSYRDRLFVSSGKTRGTYATKPVMMKADDWVFYCLASGGTNSGSEAYLATPSNPLEKVWSQDDNGQDIGTVASHLSMIYGTISGDPNDPHVTTMDNGVVDSDAVYGGIIHWNARLTLDDIQNAYDVTKVFYPSTKNRKTESVTCGALPSNEWPDGWLGRNVGPLPSIHFEKDAYGYYHPKQNTLGQQQAIKFALSKIPLSLQNANDLVYCPDGVAYPKFVDRGYYSIGTEQVVCPVGKYCKQGQQFECPAGYYGATEGLSENSCSGRCPAGFYCPIGTEKPIECPDAAYSLIGSSKCIACSTGYAKCKTSSTCCINPQLEDFKSNV